MKNKDVVDFGFAKVKMNKKQRTEFFNNLLNFNKELMNDKNSLKIKSGVFKRDMKILLADESKITERYTLDIKVRDIQKNHTLFDVTYSTDYLDEIASTVKSVSVDLIKKYEEK